MVFNPSGVVRIPEGFQIKAQGNTLGFLELTTVVALDYAKVAAIYDSYARYEDDIPFFVETARARPGRLLELMAGTGRVSLPLLEAGVEAICVELVPEMLAVLRAKAGSCGLAARLCCADVRALPFAGRFDLALLPFQGFSELVTAAEQRQALSSIYRALATGGRFVCTLHNPRVRLLGVTGKWVAAGRVARQDDDGEVVVSLKTVYDRGERVVKGRQRIEEHDRHGALVSRLEVPLAFSLVERSGFEQLAAEAGFEVVSLAGGYERQAYRAQESPIMVWTLERNDD